MMLTITRIKYPSVCTSEMPVFDDSEITKLDHRAYFSHEERSVFLKKLKILGEINGTLCIEGGLRIYRYDPKPQGEKETGLIIFRGIRGDAEFYILQDEPKEHVTFSGLRRGFL